MCLYDVLVVLHELFGGHILLELLFLLLFLHFLCFLHDVVIISPVFLLLSLTLGVLQLQLAI